MQQKRKEEKNGIYFNNKGECYVDVSQFVDNFLKENKIRVLGNGYRIYKNMIWEQLDKRNLGRMIKSQLDKVELGAYKRAVHIDIEHHIRHTVDEIKLLNVYPFKVNFKNGVFNYKTLKMEEHDENNYFDYVFPYSLELGKDIETPHFDKFINETFQNNKEMIAYILYLIGYWISGTKTRQKFYILQGKGCNGKSLMIELIEKLVGENFIITIPIKDIDEKFALGNASGKKIISSSENEDNGKAVGTQMIKGLTGNDRQSIQRKYKDGRSVRLSVEIIFSINNVLKFKDRSEGFKRRVEVIPFENKVKNPDVYLSEKLEKELEGIMLKVSKAYINGVQNGIPKCLKIEEATQKYLKKAIQGNDDTSVHEFLDNHIVEAEKGRVTKNDLYNYFLNKGGGSISISEESFWRIFRRWIEINEIEVIEKRNGTRFMEGIELVKEQEDVEEAIQERGKPFSQDLEFIVEDALIDESAFDEE